MVKYFLAATALRLFSISNETQKAYRYFGNVLGQRKRIMSTFPIHYIDTAKHLLSLYTRYQNPNRNDCILEVGTGWVHWIGTILRLFYDVKITLFDICDNRQFAAYKYYLQQLQQILYKEFQNEPTMLEEVNRKINHILALNTFDELYQYLGFVYVVDSSGTLRKFKADSFSAVISVNVLEHVERSILREFIQDIYRVLKVEGFSIHQIDLSDHLTAYDRSVSRKNYYRYSDKKWKWLFESKVQYFNRVQRSEWLDLFAESGFQLVAEECVLGDIRGIKMDKRYASLCKKDRECMLLRLVSKRVAQ
jgi:predicted SAM-dependent methyltransferase